MSKTPWEQELEALSNPKREKSIYRSSRDLVESAAVDQIKRGDKTGAERGVFRAGLMSCALAAATVAESLPFIRQLQQETGEPGWFLANAALEADSAVCLESLIELGLLKKEELVWSGYKTTEGDFVREHQMAHYAIKYDALKCVSFLRTAENQYEFLQKAAEARPKQVLNYLIDCHAMPVETETAEGRDRRQGALDHALAIVYDAPSGDNTRSLSAKLSSEKLLEAGATLNGFGMKPIYWKSWNGGQVGADLLWAPSLMLMEPTERLPDGASQTGHIRGDVFFNQWSAACLLVRSAVEGGENEAGYEILSQLKNWELAKTPEGLLTPLAVLAMADPHTTTSNLRRTVLKPHEIILNSPYLKEALLESGPFNLAKIAIGQWLWGSGDPVPTDGRKVAWKNPKVVENALCTRLAERCREDGIQPLGSFAALLAAQQFVEKLEVFDENANRALIKAKLGSSSTSQEEAQKERLRITLNKEKEVVLAKTLSAFMPEKESQLFLDILNKAHDIDIEQSKEVRSALKEQFILSLMPYGATVSHRKGLSL